MNSEQGSQNFLNDDYINQTKQQRQKLVGELNRVKGEIDEIEQLRSHLDELHQEREGLEQRISAMDIILGKEKDNGISASPVGIVPEPQVQAQGTGFVDAPSGIAVGTTNRALSVRQSAEVVREILRENGPLHYRDICAEVVRRGFTVPGQDPAATLLARFSRDPNIKRVSRGTYATIQS